jgi:hypothetical protein
MLGANLLESLFVLSFNHQNPQLGLIALTHVSQLKKCLRVREEQLPTEDLEVQEDLTYIEKPTQILETVDRVTRRSTIRMCKVKWGHHSEEEATWEREDDLRAKYPELFAS